MWESYLNSYKYYASIQGRIISGSVVHIYTVRRNLRIQFQRNDILTAVHVICKYVHQRMIVSRQNTSRPTRHFLYDVPK
jgi:hypothetical protein